MIWSRNLVLLVVRALWLQHYFSSSWANLTRPVLQPKGSVQIMSAVTFVELMNPRTLLRYFTNGVCKNQICSLMSQNLQIIHFPVPITQILTVKQRTTVSKPSRDSNHEQCIGGILWNLAYCLSLASRMGYTYLKSTSPTPARSPPLFEMQLLHPAYAHTFILFREIW